MESNARERLRARIAQVAESRSHLDEGELLWRDRQPFLESKGYMLRSRYRPGWTPSWLGNDVVFEECDDWYFQLVSHPHDSSVFRHDYHRRLSPS